jgi:NADPH:quinone reductase-like Zn-dependent oxidoreductase
VECDLKAAVYRRFGPPDVVELRDLPMPTPGPGELLIRLKAATVSSADWRLRSCTMPRGFGLLSRPAIGFSRPRQPILGSELSGYVAAVGKDVRSFKAGDAVVAFPGSALGCHAEYRCIAADDAVAAKPPNMSFEQSAALFFGGATMLDFYERAQLRAGERVLVNGASGTVGTSAVQLAKLFGAHVTAVCSTGKKALVRLVGADAVFDYTQQDLTEIGEKFDVIVDTVGTAPYSRSSKLLTTTGRLLLVLADLPELLAAPWRSMTSSHRVIAGPAKERPEYVRTLVEWASAGQYSPVVDRCYRLDQVVAAHRHVDDGHKAGSVVLAI